MAHKVQLIYIKPLLHEIYSSHKICTFIQEKNKKILSLNKRENDKKAFDVTLNLNYRPLSGRVVYKVTILNVRHLPLSAN